jgi:hypothetical protein
VSTHCGVGSAQSKDLPLLLLSSNDESAGTAAISSEPAARRDML